MFTYECKCKCKLTLVSLTGTHLSSATVLRDVSPAYEIIRNDDQFDKFKNWQYFITNILNV